MKIRNFYEANNKTYYTLTIEKHYEQLYYLGLSYFESAKLLTTRPHQNHFIATVVPGIICYAYAIEYLSCCILEMNSIPLPNGSKIHNLITLFNKMPTDTQIDIQKKFNDVPQYKTINLKNLLNKYASVNTSYRYKLGTQKHSDIAFLHNYCCILINLLKPQISFIAC